MADAHRAFAEHDRGIRVRSEGVLEPPNYGGTNPHLTLHPLLLRYIDTALGPELARIPDALVVPLGVRVDEAITRLVHAGQLDGARCLVGFPHPPGRNVGKLRQWAANRAQLKRKLTAWFRQHPVKE